MAAFDNERELVRAARDRLDDWLADAREQAYLELFEGDGAALSAEQLAVLDRVDSELSREGGDGLWGTDRYGVVAGSRLEADWPRVVTVYHPEIPDEAVAGVDRLDESLRAELNDALWAYAERVAELVQVELESFMERRESG